MRRGGTHDSSEAHARAGRPSRSRAHHQRASGVRVRPRHAARTARRARSARDRSARSSRACRRRSRSTRCSGSTCRKAPRASRSRSPSIRGCTRCSGTNGANERHVNARVPGGFALEPIEFAAIDQRPARPTGAGSGRHHAGRLVRDVDALLAKATQAGVPVLTPGGKPVAHRQRRARCCWRIPTAGPSSCGRSTRCPQTTAPATSNVIGSRLTMTVADIGTRRCALPRPARLRLRGTTPSFAADPRTQALTGAQGARCATA